MNLFRQLFSRRRLYNDLSEEIQEHLEEKVDELVATGMSRKEAAAAARREFGNVTLIEEDGRTVWRWPSIEHLLMDVRYALRMVRKYPVFSAVTILTLALGIGATTVLFSVIYGLVLQPFPYKDLNRSMVFAIKAKTQDQPVNSRGWFYISEFAAFRDQNHVFDDIIGYYNTSILYDAGSRMHDIHGAFVTTNAFDFLGVAPLRGRAIAAEDAAPDAPPVFVINYKLWQSEFGGDTQVLGKSFTLNGK